MHIRRLLMLFLALVSAAVPCPAALAGPESAAQTPPPLNSPAAAAPAPWGFGPTGASRNAWRGGTPAEELQRRAVGATGKRSVNTASGINSALNDAAAKERRAGKGFAVQMEERRSAWREQVSPDGTAAPDEDLPVESRHVLGAYADVDARDDLHIRLGPEVIWRNERERPSSGERDAQSTLGLGMRFKFDF